MDMKKRDILLSLLSGLLLVLSFPNIDLELFAWFALVPLLVSMDGKTPLHGLILGFLTGFVFFLGTLYWIIVAIHTYGNIPLVPSAFILLLLIAYLSLYTATFAFLARLLQRQPGFHTILLVPALWVFLEYLRSFLLTGFPWVSLGHSQYLNLPFIQLADLTGVYGLSFIVVLVNSTLSWIVLHGSRKTYFAREMIITLLILLGSYAYGYVRLGNLEQEISSRPSLKVGLAQGNIDQAVKWDALFQTETLKIYERLSLRLAEGKPDLILWPETATPFFFQDAKEHRPFLLSVPEKTNAFLLFGSPSYRVEKGKIDHYNSAYLFSPSKTLVGKYDKIHLVPFGEYVPLSDLFFFIGSLGEGIGNFKSGGKISNFSLPQGKFGVLICFEIIFPDLCRRFVKEGADFLVTITNDAWFGRTAAPYQHLSMATFRAVENRVFIARSANTGISAFIDPRGKVMAQGKLFTEEAINGVIRLMKAKTFYTRYGDVFAWICSAFSSLLLGVALIVKRR
jgi:apolipoprotein N-acyltransferase